MARAHIHRVTHDIIIPLILRQIPRWLNHTGRAVNHAGRLMWARPALCCFIFFEPRGQVNLVLWPHSWITIIHFDLRLSKWLFRSIPHAFSARDWSSAVCNKRIAKLFALAKRFHELILSCHEDCIYLIAIRSFQGVINLSVVSLSRPMFLYVDFFFSYQRCIA